ncbi:MAG: diguanylate cyclase [Oscillospiraceae bacterium]|nr:diguanylate cyclase [Oscillospiraceae bacterium]
MGEGLKFYCECVNEMRAFAEELARGNLNCVLPPTDNEISAPLKSLHASMKHLSWQAREVARGDYNQNVDFMGEFSDSFNQMVSQLKRNHELLMNEIREIKVQNDELNSVAYFDELTGLYNRSYGMYALKTWVDAGQAFVVCFVDMDNLKFVNDKFGHSEGDKYIIKIANCLRTFPGESVVCRLGGDEFLLLSTGMEIAEVEHVLSKMRSEIIRCYEIHEIPYYASLSYGVVKSRPGELSASELLSLADSRMYEFKRKHKMERK